jgi:NAD(P)-dependent dehydrogenase (short-subunit alcohol dehydrogenase family)
MMHTNVLGRDAGHPAGRAPGRGLNGGKGRFAFISSGMAQIAGADSSRGWVYRASKAALNMAVASAQHDYPQAIAGRHVARLGADRHGRPGAPLTVVPASTDARRAIRAHARAQGRPSSTTTAARSRAGELCYIHRCC